MGLETVALILSGISAVSSIVNANAEADAAIKEGNIVAANKAKETQLKAARLQSSFLSSGLTLEGTPSAAVGGVFRTGLEDIAQIRSNYNTKAKNIRSAGRTAALGTLATAFVGMDSAALGKEWGMGTSAFAPIGEIPGAPMPGLTTGGTMNWQTQG